jgi:hypothetical protein
MIGLLLSSQIIPAAFGASFSVLVFITMRLMRRYLAEKPRSAEAESGNVCPLAIGRETVYVTKLERESFMRNMRIAFLLIAAVLITMILQNVLVRVFRF